VDFVAGNSNKLQKLSLYEKISSVFTLGPTAQATLVSLKSKMFLSIKDFNV
jgi:hypothetical protein